jgi:hypothetical protein
MSGGKFLANFEYGVIKVLKKLSWPPSFLSLISLKKSFSLFAFFLAIVGINVQIYVSSLEVQADKFV